jgi:hypothetical protein
MDDAELRGRLQAVEDMVAHVLAFTEHPDRLADMRTALLITSHKRAEAGLACDAMHHLLAAKAQILDDAIHQGRGLIQLGREPPWRPQ